LRCLIILKISYEPEWFMPSWLLRTEK
jgi:hypothetical protein